MTWYPFVAGPGDFAGLLDAIMGRAGATVYETYSVPGHPLRTFASGDDAVGALDLGHDRTPWRGRNIGVWRAC